MRLAERIRAELESRPPAAVVRFADHLADAPQDAAILYYGSTLRTGDLSGLLDFYRLTWTPHRKGVHGLAERLFWPEVSYHEFEAEGVVLRAKVATMPLPVFLKAAEGRTLDTTIWTRFVQPAQMVWSADAEADQQVVEAVVEAVKTAGRYAAALGPDEGPPDAYWTALFRRTYATEFRVENPDRADTVLGHNAERFAAVLPLAWAASDLAFVSAGATLRPSKRGLPNWGLRAALGKPLNLARLAKAAFTFDGAARYAAYKIEKHTGIEIPVTPFRERHPILAAPGVLWRLRQARKSRT